MPDFDEQNGSSDFDQPRWAVINSETCAASNLSYAEAAEKLRELSATTHGLCIVTDETAERLCGTKNGDNQQESEDLTGKAFAEML